MVTFTCARCKEDVDRLFQVRLASTEVKMGELVDGAMGDPVELCSSCNELIDTHFGSLVVGQKFVPVEGLIGHGRSHFDDNPESPHPTHDRLARQRPTFGLCRLTGVPGPILPSLRGSEAPGRFGVLGIVYVDAVA